MPLFDTEKFWANVDAAMKEYPRWRKGQTVFNVMEEMYSDAANHYRASSIDPFHVDSNIPEFVVACRNLVSEQQE